MNKYKSILVLAIAASILLAFVAPAWAVSGDGEWALVIGSITGPGDLEITGVMRSDSAGLFLAGFFKPGIKLIAVGRGDPMLSYELEVENTTDEMMDGELFLVIDIDPSAGGLPVLATLEVEVTDPGGEGVDMEVDHVTVLQGNDLTFPSTFLFDVLIEADITQAGTTLVTAGPVLLPDPLPVEGTTFIRLEVDLLFGGLAPGDSAVFRGSTVIVTEPGDFDFDGDTDGFDLLVWQRGESLDPLSQSDLNDWQANFGNSTLVANIPEPSTLLLGALAVVGLLVRSHSRDCTL